MNKVFEESILSFEKKVADLNSKIEVINSNEDLSQKGKDKLINEVLAEKSKVYDILEAELLKTVDRYEPKFEYKQLEVEDFSKISALLNIAKASDRVIDDNFLTNTLNPYKETYNLLELAEAMDAEKYPNTFKKELSYLKDVKAFKAFKNEISEIAKIRTDNSYSWNRLKLMTSYNDIKF